MELLTDRYSKKIRGKLSCYDRVVISGTLPRLCFSEGMTSYWADDKNVMRLFVVVLELSFVPNCRFFRAFLGLPLPVAQLLTIVVRRV